MKTCVTRVEKTAKVSNWKVDCFEGGRGGNIVWGWLDCRVV